MKFWQQVGALAFIVAMGSGLYSGETEGTVEAAQSRPQSLGDDMTASKTKAAHKPAKDRQEQSAAAPSPFPPVADYAFLSN